MTDQTSPPQPPSRPTVSRDPIVAAFMEVLAEKRFEDIGFAEIARRAGVPLSEVRAKHASKIEMLAAHMRAIDCAVLDGIEDGSRVRLTTRARAREAVVELCDTLQPGHLALPNGLGLTLERGGAVGVAPNELTRAVDRDPWVGTPWHKHVPASVEPLVVFLFMIASAPVGAHLIGRAAFRTRVPLDPKTVLEPGADAFRRRR